MKVELGVVEDRKDPEQMGRVRVRILGKHTPDRQDIPTEDLPWATVMLPTTSPSVSGLGHTQFLVEGSWVVVAFHDEFMQDPIVLGSIGAMPNQPRGDSKVGFNDPLGIYPRPTKDDVPEPDYNKLGRGLYAGTHEQLRKRRAQAASFNKDSDLGTSEVTANVAETGTATSEQGDLGSIATQGTTNTVSETDEDGGCPIATAPELSSVMPGGGEDRSFWKQPTPGPTGGFSQYPYNHVYESESGHVIEVDDTKGGERLMTQHRTGTFEEIYPDGTKVTRIVKDNYDIIMSNNNVYIGGSCNLTIEGDLKTLIKGNYTLEVEGNYNEKIGKNRNTKVGSMGRGNYSFEILGNQTGNVVNANTLNTGPSTLVTRGSHNHTCALNYSLTSFLSTSMNAGLSTNIDTLVTTKISGGLLCKITSTVDTFIAGGALIQIGNKDFTTGLINTAGAVLTNESTFGTSNIAGVGIASTAVGGITHLAGGLFKAAAGLEASVVAGAALDLTGGANTTILGLQVHINP